MTFTARKPGVWRRLVEWVKLPGKSLTPQVVLVYLLGAVALACLYYTGAVVPIVVHGGVVVNIMAAAVVVHAVYATCLALVLDRATSGDYTTRRVKLHTTWLEYIDSLFPGLGFVGTLLGAIQAFGAVDASTGVDGVAAMVGNVMSGLSVAIYTTLAGLVLALWTSVVTRLLQNTVARRLGAN